MRRGILAIPAALMMVTTAAALTMPAPKEPKAYRDMTTAARTTFVVQRARHIAGDLCGDGRTLEINAELAEAIRVQLDAIIAPRRSGERAVSAILERGIGYGPTINAAFRAAKLPTSLGIALAMSESEFAECAVSPAGARGMFQFMPKTGERFGLDAEGLCNVERSAAAAASYHSTLRSHFPGTSAGALVALLAYNTGEKAAENAFGDISRRNDPAAIVDFWRVVQTGMDATSRPVLSAEGQAYLPRLLACAIVAESPGAFGVSSSALSGL